MKVIFSGNWLPGAAAIRIFTQSRWHHCGVIWGESVIESRMLSGTSVTTLAEFKERGNWAIIDIPMTDEQNETAIEYLLTQVGASYDYSGIFAVLMVRREWQNPTKWYCSELVAEACRRAGVPIARPQVAGVSPQDIWVQAFDCIEANVPDLIELSLQ